MPGAFTFTALGDRLPLTSEKPYTSMFLVPPHIVKVPVIGAEGDIVGNVDITTDGTDEGLDEGSEDGLNDVDGA